MVLGRQYRIAHTISGTLSVEDSHSFFFFLCHHLTCYSFTTLPTLPSSCLIDFHQHERQQTLNLLTISSGDREIVLLQWCEWQMYRIKKWDIWVSWE